LTYDYGNRDRMSEQIATVTAIYDAFARRDVEAALVHCAPDVVLVPSGTNEVSGRTEPYVGHAGVREYFAAAEEVWSELTLYAEDIRAAATGVVVFGRAEGRAGDQRVRVRVMWTWVVRDGLAESMRVSVLGDVEPR
jgi:ketosteroid isomerase-like protein